jgi:hypothetical protein
MRNFLEVAPAVFKYRTKIFRGARRELGPVLLSYEGGLLSIESGDATAVMHAIGEWHGRAKFSPELLRALATVPPDQDPIKIVYSDKKLQIGGVSIACEWSVISEAFIHNLQDPSILDLLVMERSLPRIEVRGAVLGKKDSIGTRKTGTKNQERSFPTKRFGSHGG